jgi:hypothetical protein
MTMIDDDVPRAEADDLLSRAYAVLAAHLRGDEAAIDVLLGNDIREVLLVAVGLLLGSLINLLGKDTVAEEIDRWLDNRRDSGSGLP